MKIDPYYQRQKCVPMTVVSGNIRFIRIFAEVLWRAANVSGVINSDVETLVDFPLIPKHMNAMMALLLPRDAPSAKRGIAIVSRPSVRLSVRLTL